MFDSSTRTVFMATAGKQQQRAEDTGMGDLFDNINDLLDFDDEEAEDALVMVEPCVDKTGAFLLPPLPPPTPVAAADDGGFGAAAEEESPLECSSNRNPCDVLDIVELDWAPKFLDDSVSFFLDDIDIDAVADDVDGEMAQRKGADACFRTSSPVSVLEANAKCGGGGGGGSVNGDSSSSSSSSSSTSYLGSPPELPSAPAPMIPARARSKRRRPATFAPPSIITAPVVAATPDPESSGDSFPRPPAPAPAPKKRKSGKKSPSAAAEEEEDDEWGGSPPPPPTARKCTHCGIQKTPQWRAGPMGPKTLCNACGVRYKSGRLFPEYRPAASPTFVPSLHSNSHKKVVEMRNRATGGGASETSSDGCDLLEDIRRRH